MDLVVIGSLERELPKAEGVAFHTARFSLLQECFPYVGTAGLAATLRLRCGGRQLPQSRACGASQLPREGAFFIVLPG